VLHQHRYALGQSDFWLVGMRMKDFSLIFVKKFFNLLCLVSVSGIPVTGVNVDHNIYRVVFDEWQDDVQFGMREGVDVKCADFNLENPNCIMWRMDCNS